MESAGGPPLGPPSSGFGMDFEAEKGAESRDRKSCDKDITAIDEIEGSRLKTVRVSVLKVLKVRDKGKWVKGGWQVVYNSKHTVTRWLTAVDEPNTAHLVWIPLHV